jgi:hypothetical protein
VIKIAMSRASLSRLMAWEEYDSSSFHLHSKFNSGFHSWNSYHGVSSIDKHFGLYMSVYLKNHLLNHVVNFKYAHIHPNILFAAVKPPE